MKFVVLAASLLLSFTAAEAQYVPPQEPEAWSFVGSCVPDSATACLLNNRYRATLRFRNAFDDHDPDTNASVKPVTGFGSATFETVFFYFNNSNNIEVMLKMLDQGNTNGSEQPTIAVLYGSATPLRITLTIADTKTGSVRTYTSSFGFMAGQTDFTAFVK